MNKINYPPEEIFNPVLGKKNFKHIILWMLYNNEECEWSNFTEEPLELRLSTLSKYLSLLKGKQYVENISRGHYKITSEGRNRFLVCFMVVLPFTYANWVSLPAFIQP